MEHDLAGRDRMMPRDVDGRPTRPIDPPPGVSPRSGAVLLLLYPSAGKVYVPLTVRAGSLRHHSGEVSLPGGSFDAADGALQRTALREAWEELGIVPETVELVCELAPVWIPVSNFRIMPYLGVAHERPDFKPSPGEVATVIEAPIGELVDPANVASEVREIRGRQMHVPYFAIAGHKVWGATALILAQLVSRLEAAAAR